MLFAKLILGIIAEMAVFGGLLFLPAGTLDWPHAWLFLAVIFLGTVWSIASLYPGNTGLLEERLKSPIQEGQPLADRIVLLLFLAAFYGVLAFIPLDVFRFHLMGKPGIIVASFGLVLFITGWWIITLALRENPFAAPVVRHQKERRQTVIDTGVYGVVRHPMFTGAIPLLVGMPLWLESYAAAVMAGIPIGLLVLRIRIEEAFLRRELKGYQAYTERVRFRLVPFLW
ncbi:isoprenylcysteine carboxylmethyltransferase family protein [Methylocaldum sp.]|uniref:methyltransferase family protein n=1 Tax=Methylocaldum sp. TaxID=1969727 RepID=UPI002D53C1DD|nr:isoprenylcysteine carboxylmethyltransferase family protein [Methylocaldum sp.]HYE36573.1 isoprenylcysteine carboxylmethyltransferase family protein [Methylocaldum sp.]